MPTSPVLLLFGAGPNIGAGVARAFAAKGYKIALASRTKKEDFVADQKHYPSDLSDPLSIAGTFAKVRQDLGIPSVVVYNAASNVKSDKANPAALSVPEMIKDMAINTFSVLAAADEAVKGFRELPSDAAKTFIYTGNRLNIEPIPPLLSNGMGKSATAHFLATAAMTYAKEGLKFYYADERETDGKPVYGRIDGPASGAMYLQLAEGDAQGPWHTTFVKGKGYKNFGELNP